MDKDILNRVLTLCGEIEERQTELKKLISLLTNEPLAPEIAEPELSDLSDQTDQTDLSDVSELPDSSEKSYLSDKHQPAGADLRKAFTINDRFRFKRELFGGDDKAMVDVIARLSEANSFDEANAYLIKLGWSSDNEAANEFKEIVSTFFNGYRL